MSSDIKVINKSLHHINIDNNSVNEVDISSPDNDFETYLELIAKKITDNSNDSREFKFSSSTTEVRASIVDMLENGVGENPTIIAERLLLKEVDAQDRYSHLTSIQKGSLLQTLIEYNGINYFIITKVDHLDFLDESDLKKRVGLPFEEHVLKACLVEIEDGEISDIVNVFDSLNRISEYWYKEFLELIEAKSDDLNTRNAFKAIELQLSRKLKRHYKADYTYLTNNLISYFRTNSTYSHSTMVESVIGDYEPVNENLDVGDLKTTLRELVNDRPFDSNFGIVQKIIKKKYSRVYQLDENIDLKLKKDIENLRGRKITGYKAKDGRKFVMIESEKGYEFFRDKELEDTDDES